MKAKLSFVMLFSAILALQLSACESPSLASPSPRPTLEPAQGLVEDLSAFIPAQMQAANVPGLSTALIQDGEIVWVEGFGKANTITGKPVAGDTVFEAASIGKAIAAYAALVLVERGVLALDEPVHQYLSQPWLPPSAYAEQVTLRQLLSHTSGLTTTSTLSTNPSSTRQVSALNTRA